MTDIERFAKLLHEKKAPFALLERRALARLLVRMVAKEKKLHTENLALRAALKPFAKIPLWRDFYPDAKHDSIMIHGIVRIEHVRAARVALAGEK